MNKTLLQPLINLGTPRRFYYLCQQLLPWFLGLFVVTLSYGLIGGLFFAPSDYQQGDGFRIIYLHVPCALMSMMIYAMMAVASAIYLIWRIKIADIVAYAIAPVGAMITALALITGSIWGKPMWGTWWIWDARLTSELILLFLYIGYIALYQSLPEHGMRSKAAAILAIVGFCDIPIIHYSVIWWNTLHQGPTITKLASPSIAPEMLYPLLSMIIALMAYVGTMVCIRAKTEIIKRDQDKTWVQVLLRKGLPQ
jgi:heme exporter protein C